MMVRSLGGAAQAVWRRVHVPQTSRVAQTSSVPTATVKHVAGYTECPVMRDFDNGYPGSSQPRRVASRRRPSRLDAPDPRAPWLPSHRGVPEYSGLGQWLGRVDHWSVG